VAFGEPAHAATGRSGIRWTRIAGLLAAAAALALVLAHRLPASSSPAHLIRGEHRAAGRPGGEADGSVPDGTTVFADDIPGVAKLDPALLGALRRAAAVAAGNGVSFVVDSGWRSRAYQERLFRAAVAKYGSAAAAARWVATPSTSAHVSGDAVDMGRDAAAWLSAHGAAYGLCQIYGNEPWHYELRREAGARGCPPRYADPTQDPRMRR
jgi:hypothetical protein